MLTVLVVMKLQDWGKKHVLVFQTDKGQLTVATDDLQELEAQGWFRAFMNLSPIRSAAPQRQEPLPELQPEPVRGPPQQQQYAPRPRQPMRRPEYPQQQVQIPPPLGAPSRPGLRPQSFMDIDPDSIDAKQWEDLTAEEQHAYAEKWGIQLPE